MAYSSSLLGVGLVYSQYIPQCTPYSQQHPDGRLNSDSPVLNVRIQVEELNPALSKEAAASLLLLKMVLLQKCLSYMKDDFPRLASDGFVELHFQGQDEDFSSLTENLKASLSLSNMEAIFYQVRSKSITTIQNLGQRDNAVFLSKVAMESSMYSQRDLTWGLKGALTPSMFSSFCDTFMNNTKVFFLIQGNHMQSVDPIVEGVRSVFGATRGLQLPLNVKRNGALKRSRIDSSLSQENGTLIFFRVSKFHLPNVQAKCHLLVYLINGYKPYNSTWLHSHGAHLQRSNDFGIVSLFANGRQNLIMHLDWVDIYLEKFKVTHPIFLT
ncbi:hypothetical protein DSO57_1009287 [Entomophthora muscae]|uniref:Uncharacterized protein n=2 Tax=Entomophthora muscae TaxID=34485 RepID=A0ACC2USG7_9FUNG|nr:hypothetical protein DSO57_1034342 [Entomophthora muscae]KAJ9089788.1 hypothetical protein DSO57_1009287 [Entomophthora muscae]